MLVHDHLIVFDIVLLKKTDLDGVFFVCVFVFVLFFLKTELGTAFSVDDEKDLAPLCSFPSGHSSRCNSGCSDESVCIPLGKTTRENECQCTFPAPTRE